jgi:capsular polysaccharide biosynthesis protein
VNESDQTAALSASNSDDLAGELWALGEFATDDDRAASDLATGLTSVGYVRAALRRGVRVWCALAVVGLLIGAAAYKAFPPAYQASTTILLGNNNFEQPGAAVLDDQALVQSRTVATGALQRLGLHEDPAALQANYSAVVVTNRVLSITVKTTSYQAAIKEANAVAAAFLAFQRQQLYAQEQQVTNSLQQEINQSQQRVNQIRQQLHQPSVSPAQRAKLATELGQQNSALTSLKLANQGNQNTMRINTAMLVDGSRVLDRATPLPQHAKRYLLLYAGGGLVAGLALGLFIVAIRALVSDKLRRRDDVARALGAPVKLSVSQIRLGRGAASPRQLAAAQGKGTNVGRIVAHLEHEVPPSWGGLASLALVPVDDVQVPALCLASLALSCAQQSFQVVVADLCSGSPAARLLGVTNPGVQQVRVRDAHLTVAVPDPDDVAPVGPLSRRSRRGQADEPLADACASADLLFTLAALDPASGAGHLAGWARGAVAMVTAGRSSGTRIHAIGEMIQLSGIELISAVLVGADKTDESLGSTAPSEPQVPVGPDLG